MPQRILIALSASFYDVPANFNLLASCERIYTTQARNYKELIELFGEDRVRFIPDSSRSTIDFIRAREIESALHETVEFLDYHTLHTNARKVDDTIEKLATAQAEVTALEHNVQELLADTRRLNYLARVGEYIPKTEENPVAYTHFGLTAHQGQTLREAIDRLMVGIVFDTNNQPISTPLATVVAQSLADGTIRPRHVSDTPIKVTRPYPDPRDVHGPSS